MDEFSEVSSSSLKAASML